MSNEPEFETPPTPTGSTPPNSSTQSNGLVTAVAVVNFVFGTMQLMCGGCIGVGAGLFAGMFSLAGQQREGMSPEEIEAAESIAQFGQVGGGIIFIFAVLYVLFGIALLVAGYGVLMRHKWGRILTLVMAGLTGILAIAGLISGEAMFSTVNLLFAIFAFVVLLNKKVAVEFAR